jgi:hypothetical protein
MDVKNVKNKKDIRMLKYIKLFEEYKGGERNSAHVNYDTKTLTLQYNGEEFIFDLDEGDHHDYWHGFTFNDQVKDLNFSQETPDEKPMLSVYDVVDNQTDFQSDESIPVTTEGDVVSYLGFDNMDSMFDLDSLDPMVRQYLETALWTEEKDTDYGVSDFSSEAIKMATEDCNLFKSRAEESGIQIQPEDLGDFGHDFWLTRNGHGAGFWDKPEKYEKYGEDTLTDISNQFGTSNVEVGNDGKLHLLQ